MNRFITQMFYQVYVFADAGSLPAGQDDSEEPCDDSVSIAATVGSCYSKRAPVATTPTQVCKSVPNNGKYFLV